MENFEDAIKPYIKKKIVTNNITEFELVTFRKNNIILTAAPRTRTDKTRAIMTPRGRFETMNAAATAYNVTIQAIYGRIKRSEKLGDKEYYYVEQSQSVT